MISNEEWNVFYHRRTGEFLISRLQRPGRLIYTWEHLMLAFSLGANEAIDSEWSLLPRHK